MNARSARERALWLVALVVSLHSLLLGFTVMAFPARFLALITWPYPERPFFPSQAGVFLMLLSLAYFLALKYRGMVRFIIFSKVVAFAFLMFHFLFVGAPFIVFPTALLDGLMGATLWTLYHLTKRTGDHSRAPRSQPGASP